MALKKECPACKYRNSVSVQKCIKCGSPLKNPVYWVDIWIGGKRKRERIGPSRSAAQARELALKREKAKAKVEGKTEIASIYTLNDLWPRYLAWTRVHNRDVKGKKQRWENHLKPFFGSYPLTKISKKLVQAYQSKRITEASPATVNREIALLRHMLAKAVEWEILEQNPILGIKNLPENNDDKWKYLTDEDVRRFKNAISQYYRDLLIFFGFYRTAFGRCFKIKMGKYKYGKRNNIYSW